MKRLVLSICCAALLVAGPRPAQSQVLTGAIGAGAGLAAGGYITLSIVVARAQFGHYLHDASELLGWHSTPVLVGVGTGTTVGVLYPDRLVTGAIYGGSGTIIGGLAGAAIGKLVSNRPEGPWAGAAIGAGAGMAIGSLIGILIPKKDVAPEDVSASAVPIGFRVRF